MCSFSFAFEENWRGGKLNILDESVFAYTTVLFGKIWKISRLIMTRQEQ